MPAAYSYDLRKKAMEALDEGESRATVAKRFIAHLIIVETIKGKQNQQLDEKIRVEECSFLGKPFFS